MCQVFSPKKEWGSYPAPPLHVYHNFLAGKYFKYCGKLLVFTATAFKLRV
jgi:hypothetical protein